MAGGFHSTKPFHHSVALVANVTSKLPSALQSWCTKLNTGPPAHTAHIASVHYITITLYVQSKQVYFVIRIHPLGIFCDTDPSSIMRMGLYHKIRLEDGSVSQNTPTLTKNLSDININTWTLRQQYSNYSALELRSALTLQKKEV